MFEEFGSYQKGAFIHPTEEMFPRCIISPELVGI